MIDSILHFLGLCNDSASHPNVFNMFGLVSLVSGFLLMLKIKFKIWREKRNYQVMISDIN